MKAFKSAFILPAVLAAASCAGAFDEVIERNYSTTVVHFSDTCASKPYDELCSRMANFTAGRFERELVVLRNQALGLDDEKLLTELAKGNTQDVKLEIRGFDKMNFASVLIHITQTVAGESSDFTEIFNLNLKTERPLEFSELFEKPELAAMLCSRYIEEKYADKAAPRLPAAVAATEVMPRNFMLRPDALEFVFAPGMITPGKNSESVSVPLSALEKAGPRAAYFPALDPDFKMPPPREDGPGDKKEF